MWQFSLGITLKWRLRHISLCRKNAWQNLGQHSPGVCIHVVRLLHRLCVTFVWMSYKSFLWSQFNHKMSQLFSIYSQSICNFVTPQRCSRAVCACLMPDCHILIFVLNQSQYSLYRSPTPLQSCLTFLALCD